MHKNRLRCSSLRRNHRNLDLNPDMFCDEEQVDRDVDFYYNVNIPKLKLNKLSKHPINYSDR